MRVGRRISMVALNTNINDNLVFNNTYATIRKTTDTTSLSLYGGDTLANGAAIILRGDNDPAGNGHFLIKNGTITLIASTAPGLLEFGANRLTQIGAPTTDGDAVIHQNWAAWSPTLTWGGATPAAITTVARYTQIGRIVHFSLTIDSADSNACSALTISLPVAPSAAMPRVSLASYERYGAAGATFIDPLAFINQATGLISFAAFQTATDAQAIGISISGAYEV